MVALVAGVVVLVALAAVVIGADGAALVSILVRIVALVVAAALAHYALGVTTRALAAGGDAGHARGGGARVACCS